MPTTTTLDYTSSRLVVRVPTKIEKEKVVYENSTIIPAFDFGAATPDEVADLAVKALALIAAPLTDEPVHVDAITTARFINAEKGLE